MQLSVPQHLLHFVLAVDLKKLNPGRRLTGPCGPYSGKWGMNGVRTLTPGWQTFEWCVR